MSHNKNDVAIERKIIPFLKPNINVSTKVYTYLQNYKVAGN
jgi:hypothetical protein